MARTRTDILKAELQRHGARGEQLERGIALGEGHVTLGEALGETWAETHARLVAEFEAAKR